MMSSSKEKRVPARLLFLRYRLNGQSRLRRPTPCSRMCLARAFQTLDVSNLNHQFAVATERNSFKITGAYQDVLRWARELGTADTFVGRINRKNVGNDDMRTFIATVRGHLGDCVVRTTTRRSGRFCGDSKS